MTCTSDFILSIRSFWRVLNRGEPDLIYVLKRSLWLLDEEWSSRRVSGHRTAALRDSNERLLDQGHTAGERWLDPEHTLKAESKGSTKGQRKRRQV